MSERNRANTGTFRQQKNHCKTLQLRGKNKKVSCLGPWGGNSPAWFPGLAIPPSEGRAAAGKRNRGTKFCSRRSGWEGAGTSLVRGGGGKRMRKRGPEATLAEGQGLCDARYTMELGSQNNSAKGSLEASDEQSDGQRGERCPSPT